MTEEIVAHPHDLYDVAVWILAALVLSIGSVVTRMWFNHQRHAREGMESLHGDIEVARKECKDLITSECEKTRYDIKVLYDRVGNLRERVASLEARGGSK